MKPSTTVIPASTETYASAYARLAAVAEKLKTAGAAASVDDLVSDLRAARTAYATCKARLDSIRLEVVAEVEAADTAKA